MNSLATLLTQSVSYDEERKTRFLRTSKKHLKALADALGLASANYDLRVNKGGIAVSGEVTLHSDNLYVQVSQSCLGPDFGILIRSCKGRRDYRGGPNNHAPITMLLDTPALADRIKWLGLA